MKELQEILQQHRAKYPYMWPRDVVKLVYQNEFGPGHFIENMQASLQRIEKEYQGVTFQADKTPIEPIGNGLCRIDLWGICLEEIAILNRVFVLTANSRKGSVEQFERKLLYLCKFLPELGFPFSEKEFMDYIQNHKKLNYPAVSHSEAYRKAYSPAYRVIDIRFAPFLKLLAKIEARQKEKPGLIIGIEGNAAAGKTTLAQCLQELYDCEIIHMDDFFLPPELRTEQRLQEPGGNIHYERFFEEVVKGIRSGKEFEYSVFSCQNMDYVGKKKITNQKLLIVEGAYSMREEFRDIYDYKIFMKASEEGQKSRILKRNGEEMYQVFRQKWIPMENRYFREGRIKEQCDVIWQGDK